MTLDGRQCFMVQVKTASLMPYTAGLMRSVPRIEHAGRREEDLGTIEGFVPDPAHMPAGCAFHPRCRHFSAGLCDASLPPLEEAAPDHSLRCLRWRSLEGARG